MYRISKMSSESQYPHLYNQADKIEKSRQSKDLLYNVFMNSDTKELQKTTILFVKNIKESDRFSGDNKMSKRMERMLDVAVSDNNRLLKHSLILFALQMENWAVKYFMDDNKSPPEKVSQFVSQDLKEAVNLLLKGSYTSLQAFVEDARWRYVTL